MSLAPYCNKNLIGSFVESSCGNTFEYEVNKFSDDWWSESFCRKGTGRSCRHRVACYPHIVWVSSNPINDSGWRYANVKKTVAYIVTNENELGHPIVEKWDIKKHIKFQE